MENNKKRPNIERHPSIQQVVNNFWVNNLKDKVHLSREFEKYLKDLFPGKRVKRNKPIIDFGRTEKRQYKIDIFIRLKEQGLMWLFGLKFGNTNSTLINFDTLVSRHFYFGDNYTAVIKSITEGTNLPESIKEKNHIGPKEWEIINYWFKNATNLLLDKGYYYIPLGILLESGVYQTQCYLDEILKFENNVETCTLLYCKGNIFNSFDSTYHEWLKDYQFKGLSFGPETLNLENYIQDKILKT